MKKTISISLGILFLSACAHHRDVRPGDDGVHRVVVQTEDREEGSRDALDQANHFCEQRKQYAAVLQEEHKYTGDMDEQTYKKVKTASNVAKAAGGAAYVFGGRNESNLGGVVGLGGVVADAAAGKGYTIEIKFRCK